jgi:predicted molibdopterin-dependent oxidoreductase YjgC
MRITKHPILGEDCEIELVTIFVDGKPIQAKKGEPIAAALLAAGIRKFRITPKDKNPRGIFCGIGRCTDCIMTVNDQPNVRTCITPVEEGMIIESQIGLGKWSDKK